ncbi:hypothetical protein A0O28_0015490 [Trichoderma guizhouense]|uniref:Uncharacterized protein n=1 Tax=Trichoderma guizhouense TaxID=1491466 RepID=A0A1T3CBH4_9HYPO|nr:hypothetical protein A0O28_0015490 [Trichoderma guizhouense]
MSRIANKDATGEELNLQSPLSQTFSSDGDMDGQEADADKIDAVAATEEAEHSESDESDAAEEPQHKAPASEENVSSSDESSADEADLEERKQDDVLLNEPHNEQIDNSDAASNRKKHTSSIYTGVTEDRWSDNGSSVTTPTSEQRFSLMMEEKIVDETPKKTIQEAKEVDDSPSAPTETAHSPAVTVAN